MIGVMGHTGAAVRKDATVPTPPHPTPAFPFNIMAFPFNVMAWPCGGARPWPSGAGGEEGCAGPPFRAPPVPRQVR